MGQDIPTLEVPNPPNTPEVKSHYFVYGEWNTIKQGTMIASSPEGQPQPDQIIRMGMNEAIAMHPAIYTVLVQQARPGYTVKAWGGISKELFDWYKEVEVRKKAVIEKMAASERNGQ